MKGLLVVCGFVWAFSASAQYIAEFLPTPNGRGRAVAAGGGQIVGLALGAGGGPALWDGPNNSYSVFNTTGYSGVEVRGVGGGKQVGYGVSDSAHALMWSNLGAPPVNLQPAGYGGSIAYNTDGKTQVGVANNMNTSHAALWQGTAQSAIILHPAGYENSGANAVWGDIQVGSAAGGPTGGGAVLWRGSAASMEFLPTPPTHTIGEAWGVHGSQAVGRIVNFAAVLWDIDKWTYTPLGIGVAFDTNGVNQVGYDGAFDSRALVWSGTEESRLDLHQFLPGNFVRSIATGIDENGNISGWGDIGGFGQVPIVWKPVPEPSCAFAIAIGLALLVVRR